MKSTTRQETQDRFKKIIKQHIIDHPTADIKAIYSELADFSKGIEDSINAGSKDFLSPVTVKDYGVYKYPLREQSVRGTMAWNAAYPSNQISPPEKVDIVKVKMEELADFADLEQTHPEIYENLKRGIFMHENPEVVKKGISVFAIPRNIPEIPEWLRPYVDTTTIKNDNVSRFNAVMDSLGTDTITMNGKTFYANIKKLG